MIKSKIISSADLAVTELGFGAATLGNLYYEISDDDAYQSVEKAIESGIAHFDTAPYYGFGLSERRLGDALRQYDSSSYVISTKVGRLLEPCDKASVKYGFHSPMPFEPKYDYSYDGIMRSVEHSFQRLGLSKIDILYMHDIGSVTHGEMHRHYFKQAANGGFKAMQQLRDQGVVKAIGLGVNEYQVCEEAMDFAHFDCFLLAGRYSLLEQDALESFLPRCVKEKSSVVIGGPYNSGILATGVSNPKVVPHYNYEPAPPSIIEKVAQLEAICSEYNIPLAAAALQYPLAHEAVCSVIPGLSCASRVEKTVSLMNTHIPTEFWQSLKQQGLLSDSSPVPN